MQGQWSEGWANCAAAASEVGPGFQRKDRGSLQRRQLEASCAFCHNPEKVYQVRGQQGEGLTLDTEGLSQACLDLSSR
jgi:hypothetical protein